ncbi:MAG: AsmA-like C-terminal region-containing protein, partial [Longimicrobiales bacterium]
MSTRRRIAIAAAAIPAALLLLLATVPLLFGDRIAARIRAEINRSVAARVDWTEAGVGILREFPNVTLRLDDVTLTGVDRFAGDTLVAIDRFRIVLDLGSVLTGMRGDGPLVIRSIELREPTIRLTVLEDGTPSWDILRAGASDTPEGEAGALAVSLRGFDVHDATLTFEDHRSGLSASLTGLDHSLSGDFRQDRFTIETRAHADTASLRFAGVSYLSDVAIDVDAAIDADMPAATFTLRHARIRLNELVLDLAGSVGRDGETIALDLTFDAPGTAFGDILSLVPAVYTQDFASLRTSGTMAVSGYVRGHYGPDAFPAFALDATVEDGTFRYPDLPLPAQGISVELSIANPGGDADRTVVRFQRVHAIVGGEPLDGALTVRTPISDPDIDLRVSGTLDLADLGRTIKLDSVDQLAGVVDADVAVRTTLSAVDAAAYERIDAEGVIDVSDVALSTVTLPHALRIDDARLRITPGVAELAAFRGAIGSSDLEGSGRIENLLGFALRGEDLRGSATVHSESFDLNEWRSGGGESATIPVPPRLDFTLHATAVRLHYGELDIANARGDVRIADQRVTLDDFRMDMLGGSVAANGYYETTSPERPTFDVELALTSLDIPTAFSTLTTVRKIAPVARYARGSVSADVELKGAVGRGMTPIYDALSGLGSFETSSLVLDDVPVLGRLADAIGIEQLRDPSLETVASSFEIRGGRIHVSPFAFDIGQASIGVAGSHGIDESLAYALTVELPRSVLGDDAGGVLAGLDLAAAERVTLGVDVTGTVVDPALAMD